MPMDPGHCDPAELARLARLDLDEEERTLFTGQLQQMIEAFNPVCDLPTDNIEPFAHPGVRLPAMREDEPSPGRGKACPLAVPPLFDKGAGGER